MGRQEDTNPRALSCLNDDGCRTSVLKAECLEVCHIVWSTGGDRSLQKQVFPMPPQHCTSQAGLMSLFRNKFFKGYLGRQETSISLCFLIWEQCSAYFLSIFGLFMAKCKRKKIYAIIPTEFLTPFQVLETWEDEDLLWLQTSWFFFFCLDMIKSKWLLNIMVVEKALAFSEKILESLKHLKDRSEMEEWEMRKNM